MAVTSLPQRLRRLARRLMTVRVAAGVGWGIVAAILVIVCAAWLDLLWELSPGMRIAGITVAAIALVAIVVTALWIARRLSAPLLLAQRLDTVAGTPGEIHTGTDLALHTPAPQPVTAGLAALAIARAEHLAETVRASTAVPSRPIHWSLAGLALVLGVGVLIGVALPRLFMAQWLRFSDPFGDHPPYSRVIYHVEPGDVNVAYGGSVGIRVTTDGAAVDRIDLVIQGDAARESDVVPLFADAGGAWRAVVSPVLEPGRYHVRSAGGRSRRFRLDINTVPRLENVRFRIVPPTYANQSPYSGPLPQGGLAGLPGTTVHVWAKSNRPLSGGALDVTTQAGPTRIGLTPDGEQAREVTGSFRIDGAGKLRLQVVDTGGQASTDTFTAQVAVLPDERPFVRVLDPPAISLATPNAALPLVLSAEDDYGVARVQLYRSLNDSRAIPLDVAVPAPNPTRLTESSALPLDAYGLAPGDEIKLFGRVEDNDPSGAKGMESPIAVVRIIAQEEYEKLLRQREGLEVLRSKYQNAQRRLEKLVEETEQLQKKMEAQPPDKEADAQSMEELKALAERMREEAEAVRAAANQELPYDLDRHLNKQLEKLAEQMDAAARSAKAMGQSKMTAQDAGKGLGELVKQLAGDREQFEQAASKPLQHLAAVMPLMEDQARFIALAQRQKDLADRLASLKGRDKEDDPKLKVRMRDLQAEQQDVRAALAQLLDDIDEHVMKLPDDEQFDQLRQTATSFARAVRLSEAGFAMTEAEVGLGEFSGTMAAAESRRAAEILDSFIARCQGGMGEAARQCLQFQPALSEGLGQTVDQLLGEAGLGPNGMAGSGYSARRNSLTNVGLFGSMPALGGSEHSGSAQPSLSGHSDHSRSDRNKSSDPSARDSKLGPGATGAGDVSIPAIYRRRVAEYFRRIAEETEMKRRDK